MALIFAVLVGPLLHSYKLISGLNLIFFNPTRSAPAGMYVASFDQKIAPDDYVVLLPPEEAKPYLYGRHWTESSFLLKSVAALPGEQYEIRRSWLVMGNKSAYIYPNDSDGFPTTAPPDGIYTVPDGKVLLISWNVLRSFDSRYFGPVDQSLLVRKVVPVFVLPSVIENWLLGQL